MFFYFPISFEESLLCFYLFAMSYRGQEWRCLSNIVYVFELALSLVHHGNSYIIVTKVYVKNYTLQFDIIMGFDSIMLAVNK